ncbi:MAG: nucleotidyltransferase family protein [Chloroflexota bacterium]
MRPEDRLLFALTRQNFEEVHRQTVLTICQQQPLDWPAIYFTADLHGVAPLVYTNLQQCRSQRLSAPADIMAKFRQCLMQNILKKEYLSENLARALTFFSNRSIEVMLIKGGVLDLLVYDQPYYTMLNDIDLVLHPKREAISDQVFRELMEFFHRSGIEYDFFEHHDVSMNGILPVDFYKIWTDAVQINIEGQSVFVMSPEDMLIALCINSCRKRFFRLKSLCDIAETIRKFPKLDWQEVLWKTTIYDCAAIVYTALLATSLTLGCELPDRLLQQISIHPARTKMIQFLSRRMSLSAYSSLYSGRDVLGRKVNWHLLLPYATLYGYQIWRRIKFVYRSSHTGGD